MKDGNLKSWSNIHIAIKCEYLEHDNKENGIQTTDMNILRVRDERLEVNNEKSKVYINRSYHKQHRCS